MWIATQRGSHMFPNCSALPRGNPWSEHGHAAFQEQHTLSAVPHVAHGRHTSPPTLGECVIPLLVRDYEALLRGAEYLRSFARSPGRSAARPNVRSDCVAKSLRLIRRRTLGLDERSHPLEKEVSDCLR